MKAGGSLGFFYKHNYKWSENVATQIDMMFRYRTTKLENHNTGETGTFNYFGIDLPVYFIQQGELDNGSFFAGAGPFASFGLSNRYNSTHRRVDLYKNDQTDDNTIMKRWDFGVGIIIGYEMISGLQFNFSYQMGFRNLMSNGFENINMNSQLVGLGVGYRF